jgi:hypothetical protein
MIYFTACTADNYLGANTDTCAKCHPSCVTCSGEGETRCLVCRDHAELRFVKYSENDVEYDCDDYGNCFLQPYSYGRCECEKGTYQDPNG